MVPYLTLVEACAGRGVRVVGREEVSVEEEVGPINIIVIVVIGGVVGGEEGGRDGGKRHNGNTSLGAEHHVRHSTLVAAVVWFHRGFGEEEHGPYDPHVVPVRSVRSRDQFGSHPRLDDADRYFAWTNSSAVVVEEEEEPFVVSWVDEGWAGQDLQT